MYPVSTTLQAALAAGTPQRVLLEFTDITFSNEDIVIGTGIELNEVFSGETDIRAGLCPSSEIHFDLLNDHGQLNDFTFGTFKAWLGARIDTGTPAANAKTKVFMEDGVPRTYEFTPLGVFIADRPSVVRKKILSITANDRMTLFDVPMPAPEELGISYPTTLGELFRKMGDHLQVPYRTEAFMNGTLVIPEEPEAFCGATTRDVLSWIAEAACSIARFDRDGVLELAWFHATDRSYDEHGYTEFTPSWYETAAVDGLHVRNADSEAETVLGLENNVYLIEDNPFLMIPDTSS